MPLCSACQYGKQHYRYDEVTLHRVKPTYDGGLKDGHLRPGQMVSADQYVSKPKGRLPHTRGKERPSFMYTGGTIFINHAGGYLFISHQVSLEVKETSIGKHDFEREARSCVSLFFIPSYSLISKFHS